MKWTRSILQFSHKCKNFYNWQKSWLVGVKAVKERKKSLMTKSNFFQNINRIANSNDKPVKQCVKWAESYIKNLQHLAKRMYVKLKAYLKLTAPS